MARIRDPFRPQIRQEIGFVGYIPTTKSLPEIGSIEGHLMSIDFSQARVENHSRSRILLTDALFPNRYSSWRNVEILSFLEEFETTVLVKHGKSWAGINFEIDWVRSEYGNRLEGFNLLIFDPSYNYLDMYNTTIDGTKFNGLLSGFSYALTKDDCFKIENFDHYYHIFLGSYLEFNAKFSIEDDVQTIHLYPGGGYTHNVPINLPKEVGVVSTFPITSKKLSNAGILHIDCWSVPLCMKNEILIEREITNKPLRICFASLGHGKEKGDKVYRWIARIMSVVFRKYKIEFISIGNCAKSRFIQNIPPMSWKELEDFYLERVDIYINPVSKKAANGWPIGQEAMKQGCVVITYDVNNVSELFNGEKYEIQVARNLLDIIKYLRFFQNHRQRLMEVSRSNQKFVQRYAGYANQQEKIFQFIRGRIKV